MASDPQIELRVSRLENDSDSIYDLITEIGSTQKEHSQRLNKIETTLTTRFDTIDARFETMDARFETMDARFETIDARFDTMDARFDTIDARFDTIEMTLTEVVRRLPEPS
jgi:flagellar capping protein FliD